MATAHTTEYEEWPIAAPVSRNFDCEVIPRSLLRKGRKDPRRLQLRACSHEARGMRECFVSIVVDGQAQKAARRELSSLGLGDELGKGAPGLRFGTWARYLHEVVRMHAALEFLGWTLTPEEQATVDALDAYAERCPERFRLGVAA